MDNGITTQALIRRGIEGFNRALEWWSFELGETLRLLTWFNQPNFVEFEVNDDELLPLSGEKKTAAGARRNVKLRLDDQAFLFRRIKLPTAARKNIDRVIGYEFNKYFPMDAEDALFSCKIIPPSATSIEIEIWAIGKKSIDMYLSMIRQQHEIEILKLSIVNRQGRILITRDIEKESRREDKNNKTAFLRALNIAIAGLLLALIVYPVKRIDAYLELQQQEIERLEKQAQPIIELRQKTMAMNQRFDQLAEQKREVPNQVSIWSHVTKSMHGRVTLDRLEIDGRNVRVSGQATSVEGLLRSLESDQRITEVKINNPVKATADGLHETLNLTLMVRE